MATANVSFGALQRRLSKKAPGMGGNGPRGGARQLSPQDGRSAGSMLKKGTGHGKMSRSLAKGLKK